MENTRNILENNQRKYKPFIQLNESEIQSNLTRVKNAEGLILQLPEEHEGKNTWLLNYGISTKAQKLRDKKELSFDYTTESSFLVGQKSISKPIKLYNKEQLDLENKGEQSTWFKTYVTLDFIDRIKILFGRKIKVTQTISVPFKEPTIQSIKANAVVEIIKKSTFVSEKELPDYGYTDNSNEIIS